MINSTYNPQTWDSILAAAIKPNVIGIKATIPAGTTQNVDTSIPDDSLFRGINFIASSATVGDTVSVEIVDVNGVYVSAGTVISTPVTNFNIVSDQQTQANYTSIAPFKILGGLYIRIIYNSMGILTSPKVGVNFLLETVLF